MRTTSFRLLLWIYIAMCVCVVCTALPLWHRLLKHRDSRKIARWLANMSSGTRDRTKGRIRVLQTPYKRLIEELDRRTSASQHGSRLRHWKRKRKHGRRKSGAYDTLLKKLRERQKKYDRVKTTSTYPSRYVTFLNRRKLHKTQRTGKQSRTGVGRKKSSSIYLKRIRTRGPGKSRSRTGKSDTPKKHSKLVRHLLKKSGRRKYSEADLIRAQIERREWYLSHYGGKVGNAMRSPWPHIVPCPDNDPARFYCLNGGSCIYVGAMNATTCKCLSGYFGKRCEQFSAKPRGSLISSHPRKPTNVDWFL